MLFRYDCQWLAFLITLINLLLVSYFERVALVLPRMRIVGRIFVLPGFHVEGVRVLDLELARVSREAVVAVAFSGVVLLIQTLRQQFRH